MHTGDGWRLGRRPELDGLRGVAILLVVVSHGLPRYMMAGAVGVTVFFTLSGFLITSLLLEEHAATGRLDLRHFYERRVRRLGPALVVFLAAMAVLGLTVNSWFATPGWLGATLFYVTNWGIVQGGAPGALGHTWSLSIEEQFYIVFPLLVLLLARRPSVLIAVTAAITAVSVGLRVVLWQDGASVAEVYYGTHTTVFAPLAGALLAMALHGRPVGCPKVRVSRWSRSPSWWSWRGCRRASMPGRTRCFQSRPRRRPWSRWPGSLVATTPASCVTAG